jgi:hypothetical protein
MTVYFVELPTDNSDELSIGRYVPFFFLLVKRVIAEMLQTFHKILFERLYSLKIQNINFEKRIRSTAIQPDATMFMFFLRCIIWAE